MLVIKAEIWPGGDGSRAIEVGRIEAANVSGLADVSSYEVIVHQFGNERGCLPGWTESFDVEQHRRSDGCWVLINKVLERLFELRS